MRVLLADGRTRVRFALRALLEEQPGLMLVGEVADGRALLSRAKASCPDLILLSWELPGLAQIGSLGILRRTCPGLYVIVLSGRREARQAAMAAGADAFVSKVTPPEHLMAAIVTAQYTKRRQRMSEATREEKGRGVYAAILALAFVALATVVACLVVSLTLISEIPFHHIFPH